MSGGDGTDLSTSDEQGRSVREQNEEFIEQEDGRTTSEAGSSFSDTETTTGGADAGPGTPDSVPDENAAETDHQGEDGLKA